MREKNKTNKCVNPYMMNTIAMLYLQMNMWDVKET